MTTAKLTPDSTECPHCGSDLRGAEIPKESREAYGGSTHFSRQILVVLLHEDYWRYMRCPDCGAEDEREGLEPPREAA